MAVAVKDLGKWRNDFPASGIVPEGLVKRLDHILTWEPADSPRGLAIKEAADVLRHMPVKMRDAERMEDSRFAVKSYRVDTSLAEDAKEMRIVMYAEHAQKNVIAVLTFDSVEAYEYAQIVLKNYDKLEGIK